jgi:Transcriptional regulators
LKTVTINDVAKKAGVSKSTVSHVLSGKRPIGVEVTQRVLKTIEELNYKPNVVARNLATRKTRMVGFYGPSTKSFKNDVFLNELIAGIIDVLDMNDYKMIYNPEKTNNSNGLPFDLDSSQPVDGAIIMNPRIGDDYLLRLKTEKIPFVLIGRPSDDLDIFYVDNDNVASTYSVINDLISKGHRQIILINSPKSYTMSEDREKGYMMAYSDNNLPVDGNLIFNVDICEEDGYDICSRLIGAGNPFSAVFACNDIVAVGVIKALKENKVKIPGKVVVIGEGDTLIARIHSPAISSINLGEYDIGATTAGILLDVIEKRRIKGGGHIMPSKLVERETS